MKKQSHCLNTRDNREVSDPATISDFRKKPSASYAHKYQLHKRMPDPHFCPFNNWIEQKPASGLCSATALVSRKVIMTMTRGEVEILHSFIDSSTHYLEFGSGESTIYASKSPMVKSIDSVESSQKYIDDNLKPNADVARALSADKLRFHVIDIGKTNAWGYPKDKSKKHLWPNYSLSVFSVNRNYDLVLVDGRFRVACTLNCLLNTPDNCTIMIHDFWDRPEYHIVLRYLETKYRVDTLGVFSKRNNIDLHKVQSIIKAFQYLPDDKTLLFKTKNKLTKRFSERS